MKRRSGLLALLLLLGCLRCRRPLQPTTTIPTRQIKIIVPFPAGAGPDQVARLLGQHLQDAFGQTVLIENRAGALGSLGAQEVARSAPDGYTLLMGTNTTHASNVATLQEPALRSGQGFFSGDPDHHHRDGPDGQPDFPAKDLPQFLDYAKAHPNLTAGYGSGRIADISIAQLQSRGGMSLVAASYRGVPQAMTDVMAGVIDLTFGDFSVAIPQMQGGTLRGIGVTSPKRNELTPGLPALAEAMPGFEATIWYGLLAPANTPETIVNKLYAASEKVLSTPATRQKLANVGVIVSTHAAGRIRRLHPQRNRPLDGGCAAAGIEAK